MFNSFIKFINLHTGEETRKNVLDNIKANISFGGSHLWVLACAIVIASIGLNMNSTAVVIGAMLISPLMGPIIGTGVGLATFDFKILRKSLRNLLLATFVGLAVATLFFLLSPFKETQSELLSRTSPTIYDVLIAFFGGLVGIIALTRVEKGNPIPGVAIATALMPPLCTAGYGLAIGNWSYFFGALYLYAINCVFICLSTFLIIKYLKYPQKKQVDKKYQMKIKYLMSALTLAIMVPSIFLAHNLLQEKQYNENAQAFIQNEIVPKGHTLVYQKISPTSRKIELALLYTKITTDQEMDLELRLVDYELEGTDLIIRQDTVDVRKLISKELDKNETIFNEKDLAIKELQQQISLNTYNNESILEEVQILYPSIITLSIANHIFPDINLGDNIPVFIYESELALDDISANILRNWLEKRLDREYIEVLYRKPILTLEESLLELENQI
jgi:uncharacterized hydrophobic protein (TIGR00271 family)